MTPEQEVCVACQECCKWVTFTVDPGIKQKQFYLQYYTKRGFNIRTTEKGSQMIVSIPVICPELTPFGCKSYNLRPYLCKAYDGRKDITINCKLREYDNEKDRQTFESKEAEAG